MEVQLKHTSIGVLSFFIPISLLTFKYSKSQKFALYPDISKNSKIFRKQIELFYQVFLYSFY